MIGYSPQEQEPSGLPQAQERSGGPAVAGPALGADEAGLWQRDLGRFAL